MQGFHLSSQHHQCILFFIHSIQVSLYLLSIIKASFSSFTASRSPSFFSASSRHPLLHSQHPGLPLSSQHRQGILLCIHSI
jgi:hypothetical protein